MHRPPQSAVHNSQYEVDHVNRLLKQCVVIHNWNMRYLSWLGGTFSHSSDLSENMPYKSTVKEVSSSYVVLLQQNLRVV